MFKNKHLAKDYHIFAALLSLILVVTGGVWLTTNIVKDQLLAGNAQQVGREWLNGLTSYIPKLKSGLNDGEHASLTEYLLNRHEMDGQVFRYKLYDKDGTPIYDSTQKYLSFDPSKLNPNQEADLAALIAGEDVVHIRTNPSGSLPRSYAQASIPIISNDRVSGVLEVYLDQTDFSAALDKSFRTIAIVTALLLSISVLLLGRLAVQKHRERMLSEKALKHAHTYDKLTGLPNRDEFIAQLTAMAASSGDNNDSIAVLCLDIDDFKKLNDTLGFDIGNHILLRTSEVCTNCVRQGDIVARISDDKFALAMCRNFGSGGIQDIATRLNAHIAQPLNFNSNIIHMTSSIGIGFAKPDEADAATLLKNAEVALHWSKSEGGGAIRVFQRSMDKTLHEQMNLESELRHAVMNDSLELFYQPQIDMRTGTVIGCEALMRWEHPKRGFISPEIFISLAEETGLIHRMGEWALKRACNDALAWPNSIKIAVNLSPRQIEAGGLGSIVSEALEQSGLHANRLELEVTENILLKDSERAIATLDQLRDAGISIAMDDFGTGYSSLAYLSQFRFDKIKIDRSFIMNMEQDPQVVPIIRTMITLGHSLGSKVIAEGVEKQSDIDLLLSENCELAQGYFYAKPMPQSQLLTFLEEQNVAARNVMVA